MRTQLVAARTVAEALADSPTARTPTSSGRDPGDRRPARGEPRRRGASWSPPGAATVRVEAASDPDDPEQALYATGALLPGPDAVLAGPTFEEWLDSTA